MITTTLIVAFLLYLAFLVATLYICVFADPATSPVAAFITETLPAKVSQQLKRVLGRKTISVLEFFADRILILIYCAVVFGAWSIIFNYVYPWIDRQSYVSNFHKYVGCIVFAACVLSWHWASTTSPGVITAKTIRRYDHFPYDDLLYVANRKCPTTGIPRLARSKYDRFKYNNNVPRFDHFCGWVYNTIGEENYRFFLLFLLVHVGMCAYGASVVGLLFRGEILEKKLNEVVYFNRITGEELEGSKTIIIQYLFNTYTLESATFLLMVVMGFALALFLGYHIHLTSKGMTTNESYKWGDVRKWHKSETKRYLDAVKKGKDTAVAVTNTPTSQPIVGDGDVTCTPGSETNAIAAKVGPSPADAVQDVGPMPKNVYDRGFVQNWMEVIFPLSLRRRVPAPVSASNESAKVDRAASQKPKAT